MMRIRERVACLTSQKENTYQNGNPNKGDKHSTTLPSQDTIPSVISKRKIGVSCLIVTERTAAGNIDNPVVNGREKANANKFM
jgi:hypothetical protein